MNKPVKRKVTNKTFRDPQWYVSLAADALDLKFASLAKNLGKALKPETQDTAKELQSLYETAFTQTLVDLSIDRNIQLDKQARELFFESIIDPNFPSHHPVFHKLLNKLELDYGNEDLSENWQIKRSEIRQRFANHTHKIIQGGDKKYENAAIYISSLRDQSEPLESAIVSHMNSVIENVEHDGLAIDQQLTLRRSYVSPAFNAILKRSTKSDYEAWEGEDLLDALIESIEKYNIPIVLHGQPGHGKTSSVKMLLTALANIYQEEQSPISVLLYEFKNLRTLNNPILDVLKTETDFLVNEKQLHGRHTVIILDGLDERQITDGSDEELKGFVSGIFRMTDRMNQMPETKLSLVLTGRSQFVGQIKSCFNSDHITYEIEDFNDDKVSFWLERFAEQKAEAGTISIKQLKAHHLDELISQPILLTISAIMLSDEYGRQLFDKIGQSKINRTMVYQTIILWSYEKKWQHSPSSSSLKDKLSFDEYFQMLKAIAFEMFIAGEENIKLSKLAIKLKDSLFDLDFIENQNESVIEDLCSQLRISFFFKGVEEKAFSFIHKSIKDFLVVEAMVEGLLLILEDCNIKRVDRISTELFTLMGSKQLSAEDHIPMLDQLLESAQKRLSTYDLKMLAIWERIGAANLNHQFSSPSSAIEMQRNLAYNYYQILSRHLSRSSEDNNLKLFSDKKVVLFKQSGDGMAYPALHDFLGFLGHGTVSNLTFKNQGIEINGRGLVSVLLNAHFFKCDFSKVKINGMHIMGCSFFECDFREAKIDKNWMSNSEFNRCDFSSSSIELLRNTTTRDYPEGLVFVNKFIWCNFNKSNLSNVGPRSTDSTNNQKKKRFLFWNCGLGDISFGDRLACVTIKYSKEYSGQRYMGEKVK